MFPEISAAVMVVISNQCLSLLHMQSVHITTNVVNLNPELCDKVCQWLVAGRILTFLCLSQDICLEGHRGRDLMVVGFTTAYHYWSCEFESHTLQPPPFICLPLCNWNNTESNCGGIFWKYQEGSTVIRGRTDNTMFKEKKRTKGQKQWSTKHYWCMNVQTFIVSNEA